METESRPRHFWTAFFGVLLAEIILMILVVLMSERAAVLLFFIVLAPPGYGMVFGLFTLVSLSLLAFFIAGIWTRPRPVASTSSDEVEISLAPEDLSSISTELLGTCPNCSQQLRLDAKGCWACRALFAGNSAWSVKPHPK